MEADLTQQDWRIENFGNDTLSEGECGAGIQKGGPDRDAPIVTASGRVYPVGLVVGIGDPAEEINPLFPAL